MTTDLIKAADKYAEEMHRGQVRKYTGEPYINHPREVAMIVQSVHHTEEMVAAALLHDVVEDTGATIEDVRERFGRDVAECVGWLTDVSVPSDGNRATRRAKDREHSAMAPSNAQTVKVADLISNSLSIVERDPDFALVYLIEKEQLLRVLNNADQWLHSKACAIVAASRVAVDGVMRVRGIHREIVNRGRK